MAIDMTSVPWCPVGSHSMNWSVIRALRGLRTFQWGSLVPEIVSLWPAPNKIANKPGYGYIYYLTNLLTTYIVAIPRTGPVGQQPPFRCCSFEGQLTERPGFLREGRVAR